MGVDETQGLTDAEQAALDAMASVPEPDPPADPAPADDPAPAEDPPAEDPPADPAPAEDPAPPEDEGDPDVPPEDPAPEPIEDPEEAKADAVDKGQAILAAAVENYVEPVPVEPPAPEEQEEHVYVVYMSIETGNYVGKYLTLILEDADNYTLTLEERVPTLVPVSVAQAAAALESEHYTIESA